MFGFGFSIVGKFGICATNEIFAKIKKIRKFVLKQNLLIMQTLKGAGKLSLPAFSLALALGKMQDVIMRVGKKRCWEKRINFALAV